MCHGMWCCGFLYSSFVLVARTQGKKMNTSSRSATGQKTLSESEAWDEIAHDMSLLACGESRFPQYGICDAIRTLLSCSSITFATKRRMTTRLDDWAAANGKDRGSYFWPMISLGFRYRSSLCNHFAAESAAAAAALSGDSRED